MKIEKITEIPKDVLWAWITRILVITYVTIGAGQQIYFAITIHEVKSNFLFAFLSGCIFIGRIGYGWYANARKTILVDIYGLIMLWTVAGLRLYFNGW